MSLEKLTSAIAEKDFETANQFVVKEIMQRISERIDGVRSDITKNLFKTGLQERKKFEAPNGSTEILGSDEIEDKSKAKGAQKDIYKTVEDQEDIKYIKKLTHLTKTNQARKMK